MRNMLCVGGPSDGRYQMVGDDSRDCVVPDPIFRSVTQFCSAAAVTTQSYTRTHYVPQLFRGADKTFTVLVPSGTSADTTIERLIDGYPTKTERTP